MKAMVNDKGRCFRVTIPYQIVGLAMVWATSAGLMGWATLAPGIGPESGWAILLAGAAAAWTAIFGVAAIVERAATAICESMTARIEGMRSQWVADAAESVVRRLELRELEEQVSQLVPPQK